MTSFFDKARQAAEEASRELTERAKAEAPGAKVRAKVLADSAQVGAKEMAGRKSSAYRIGEIVVTATIPPQVSFGIHRIHDLEVDQSAATIDSATLIESGAIDDAPDVVTDLDTGASSEPEQA